MCVCVCVCVCVCTCPGQLEELLSYSEDFPRQLTEFLKPHDHISWLHHLATQDYPMVYNCVQQFSLTLSLPPFLSLSFSPSLPPSAVLSLLFSLICCFFLLPSLPLSLPPFPLPQLFPLSLLFSLICCFFLSPSPLPSPALPLSLS